MANNDHRYRAGKTKKDREDGAFKRNQDNKLQRVAWQHLSATSREPFPLHTCNGKKSRPLKGN